MRFHYKYQSVNTVQRNNCTCFEQIIQTVQFAMPQPTVHKLTTRFHSFLHYSAHKKCGGTEPATRNILRLNTGCCVAYRDLPQTQPTVSLKDVSFSDPTRSPQSLTTHCVIYGGPERSIGVRFPVKADFPPLQSVQSSSGACYSPDRALFLGAK